MGVSTGSTTGSGAPAVPGSPKGSQRPPESKRPTGYQRPTGYKRVVLVVAYAENRVIGHRGGIPWHIPEDLAHFKRTTLGHTLVMGRATFESIGRPLPGRTTIVLTRNADWHAEGVLVAHSVEQAFEIARTLPGDVMVAGGAEVYALALPYATHQVLTLVAGRPEGDTHYPDDNRPAWRETSREELDGYSRVWLIRRDS